jgi:4-hydroxy-2-oxoheptanedioate aldolase
MTIVADRLGKFRQTLRAKSVLIAWSMLCETTVLEAAARCGYDCVCVDYQHGVGSIDRAPEHARAIELGGALPIARLPGLDAAAAGRILDAGFLGVVCPLIDNVADAREFVAMTSYPPHGSRSFGAVNAMLRFGNDYPTRIADKILRLAMIETRGGVTHLAEILAVPGLDGIYIGPSDLALSHGFEPQPDPQDIRVIDVMKHVGAQARKVGKVAGIHTASAAYAAARIEDGFNFVTAGIDSRIVASGFKAIADALRR